MSPCRAGVGTVPSWTQISAAKLGKPTRPTICLHVPPSSSPLGPLGLRSQGQGWPHEPSDLSFERCVEKHMSLQCRGSHERGHLSLKVRWGEARSSPAPAQKPEQGCGAETPSQGGAGGGRPPLQAFPAPFPPPSLSVPCSLQKAAPSTPSPCISKPPPQAGVKRPTSLKTYTRFL